MEKIVSHIRTWLVDYCEASGMNGFVVGVSGGIDSAVTSLLCAGTGKPVLLLNMPIYQPLNQVSLADEHVEQLGNKFQNVQGRKVDLTSSFQQIEATLPDEIQDALTMANTRSRLRMITLYAFAGHHKMLVVGTGNKVEDFGVGFFTKYGDGGVDISPIADLLKSEVYAMGRFLGVSQGILNAAPTDGLWEDERTDESQIGATYAELEWAMAFEETRGNEAALTLRQQEVLSIYRKFNLANRHKMNPIPVCDISGISR